MELMEMMVFSDEQRRYIERYLDEKIKSHLAEKNTNILERLYAMESEIKILYTEMKAVRSDFQTEIKAIRNEMKLSLDFIDKRFNFLQWFIGLGFLALGTLVTLFKFLG